MEDKQILPHQEITKLVNLGTDDEKKEVKMGSSLDSLVKKEITDLLREYTNIFRLVLSRYAKVKHRDNGALVANEA